MIKDQVVDVGNRKWKIREAVSMEKALDAIAEARVTGSVGCKLTVNRTYVGGGITVDADVVQLNEDGTERQPYA